ncbi:hypothetical protein [Nannocystis radixulma]|uniref:Uncharacterized protein n=1 Tax=Nannocystis radixulma TaxID=2995305 RepID=A0ABT5BNF8_9BACT|nr:hypothetical protein [Nannocystis radixulma]MDC0675705.1 hypothetical protein [Nannocystis radixulma]
MTGFDTRFLDVTPNAKTGLVLFLRARHAPELDKTTVADLVARTHAFPPEMLWTTPAVLRERPTLAPLVGSLWLDGEASEREVIEPLALPRWTHARIDAPNDHCLRDALAFLPASVRSIAIASRSVSLDAVLAVLARPSLEELAIEHHDNDVAKALRQQKRLPRLRRLQLAWTGLTADGGRLLAREELADLESLSIQVRARAVAELGAALAAHRALRVLSIDAQSNTDPKLIAALVAALPDTIEELELKAPHDFAGAVSAALAGRRTPLRALALATLGLHHLDLRAPVFASLERLELHDGELGDRVIDALIDRAPPLVDLDLASCDIGPEGSTALARSRLLDRVERLSLTHDPIDPRAPLALLERPGFVERIVALDLESCGLPASTVDPVLAALATAPRLARAWLPGNALGREGIAALRALQGAHVSVGGIPERPVRTPEPLHERHSLERERREREVPAPPVPLVRPWPRIDRWLAANARAVLRSLRPPLRDADAALAKAARFFGRIGEPLADAYRAHDGQKGEGSQILGAMRAPDNALLGARHELASALGRDRDPSADAPPRRRLGAQLVPVRLGRRRQSPRGRGGLGGGERMGPRDRGAHDRVAAPRPLDGAARERHGREARRARRGPGSARGTSARSSARPRGAQPPHGALGAAARRPEARRGCNRARRRAPTRARGEDDREASRAGARCAREQSRDRRDLRRRRDARGPAARARMSCAYRIPSRRVSRRSDSRKLTS